MSMGEWRSRRERRSLHLRAARPFTSVVVFVCPEPQLREIGKSVSFVLAFEDGEL